MNSPELVSNVVVNALRFNPVVNATIFNTMRTLKRVNPGDTYLENYLWHFTKRGNSFVDYYHLLWHLGAQLELKNVMEIGCRTGISICQLLSAMIDLTQVNVVLFDIFADGFTSPEIVKMNMKALNLEPNDLNFVIGDSSHTLPIYKDSIPSEVKYDYILVDGNHEKAGARMDLENVLSLTHPGTIILFDDIAEDGCNLKDVWDSFKNDHNEKFIWHENYDGKGIGVAICR